MSYGFRKVSDSLGKLLEDVSKVEDDFRKVSNGGVKVIDGVRRVLVSWHILPRRCQKVSKSL